MSGSAADEDDAFNVTGISHRVKTDHVVRSNPLYGENYKRFLANGSDGTINVAASASNKSVIGSLAGIPARPTRQVNEFGENVSTILTDLDEELEVRNWRYQLSKEHF